MIAYDAAGAPLGFTMLAYALLWRNAQAMRQQQAGPALNGGAAPPLAALPSGRVRG
jgi:hypothetical protein